MNKRFQKRVISFFAGLMAVFMTAMPVMGAEKN